MAARSGGAGKAVLLLSAYSAGLALPFLAAGLFFERLSPLWAWFKRHGRGVRLASGALLVVIGLSMALGRLTAINAVAARTGFALKAFAVSEPVAAKVWIMGLLVALAAALAVPPLVRKTRFAHPVRIVGLGTVVVLMALEASGLISVARVVSDWLLFQGI
jgi:cytochrome c-type biogenesis protein